MKIVMEMRKMNEVLCPHCNYPLERVNDFLACPRCPYSIYWDIATYERTEKDVGVKG